MLLLKGLALIITLMLKAKGTNTMKLQIMKYD
jgi:hypothetical protein